MKKLLKPLIILIILIGAALAVKYAGRDLSRPEPDVSLDVDLEPVRIARIEITSGEKQVTLLRGTSGDWQVKTPAGIKPADSEQISNALTSLGNISTTDIVSHNPQKQADYRVDDSGGTRVCLYSGDDNLLEDILIGKLGGFNPQSMQSQMGGRMSEQDFYTFMRRADSDRVFKVQGFFGGMLGTDTDQWRDHDIMVFEPTDVRKVSLGHPDQTVVLEADTSGAWVMAEPADAEGALDSLAARKVVGALSTLRASGFVDSSYALSDLGLDPPAFSASVSLENGTIFQVAVGNEIDDNLFYCKRPDNEQIYTLAEFRLDQIRKKAAELMQGAEEE